MLEVVKYILYCQIMEGKYFFKDKETNLIESWAPRGSRLNSTWVPRGSRLNNTWAPRGSHVNSMWDPHEQCTAPRGATTHELAPILGPLVYVLNSSQLSRGRRGLVPGHEEVDPV